MSPTFSWAKEVALSFRILEKKPIKFSHITCVMHIRVISYTLMINVLMPGKEYMLQKHM